MKRPVVQYVCLIALFLISASYQIRVTEFHFPSWFGQTNSVGWPFYPETGRDGIFIGFLKPEATGAGLRDHDLLLAVDSKPVTGTAIYGEALAAARPADVLQVTVRSNDGGQRSAEKTVAVKLTPFKPDNEIIAAVLLFVVMPAFSLLLGFWVAAVRPRDSLAWLLLALLMSFTTFVNSGIEVWGPTLRDLGMIYREALNSTWSVWMLLFGMYFPEPFPARDRRPWWDWVKLPLIALLGMFAIVGVVTSVGDLESYRAVHFLERLPESVTAAAAILNYTAAGGFFACIAIKLGLAVSRDSKRRLYLLYWGATISLTPMFIFVLISLIVGKSFEEFLPHGLVLAAFLMLLLFPITLAYVIVVHKAMDVRVVVRQGLQYSVARGSVNALRTVLASVIGAGLYYGIYDWNRGRNSLVPYLVLVIGAAIFAGLNPLLESLKTAIDRRFFRDAYQAERILSELSDKVRSIVEMQPLLETVSQRISDSLHVPRVAVLLAGSRPYRPAYAIGYNTWPEVVFYDDQATVNHLRQNKEPALVYLDDPNSWIYRAPQSSEDERAKLAQLKSELLLPIAVKEQLLGFMSLGQKRSEEPYTGTDLRLLKSVAAQTGLALENARLTAAIAEEVGQRERMNREIEIAREVQERLFPQKLPVIPGLDYFGACRPALGVGGDYYDFLALPEGKLGIAIGDVSGKGIGAALMMASLQASLRSEAMRAPDDLAGLISNVNHLIFEASSNNRYATFFYAQYDPATRRLTYVNAGHNPPMLFSKSANGLQLSRLDVGGIVVGLLERFAFQQATVTLKRDDILVLFTDGVSEAMNPADEEWGEDRLIEAVQACEGAGAAEMIAKIVNAADTFSAGAKQHDDMTLVVMKVQGD